MKVNEIVTTNEQKTRIYCDLDGVLVDFDRWADDQLGYRPSDWDSDAKDQFWSDVKILVDSGSSFFGDMHPISDAFVLWNYIKGYDPTILSATGRIDTAPAEKRAWVKKYLGYKFALTAVLVPKAINKAQHATPNSILIDDRVKAIDPWIAAGGIGILHTSAADTIKQLKQLGL